MSSCVDRLYHSSSEVSEVLAYVMLCYGMVRLIHDKELSALGLHTCQEEISIFRIVVETPQHKKKIKQTGGKQCILVSVKGSRSRDQDCVHKRACLL